MVHQFPMWSLLGKPWEFGLAMWSQLEHKWHSTHLSHRGSYSVERLRAFEEFYQKTSSFQVLLVCLVLPLPALFISILVECTPLQNPLDGWASNYGYWIRYCLYVHIAGLGFLIQVQQLVPALNLTRREIFFVNTTSTWFALGLYMLVASTWVFPVPFGLVLFCPPFVLALITILSLVIGKERVQRDTNLSHRLQDCAHIFMTMMFLSVIYPAFGAAYSRLSPIHQTFFVILLPIIKAIMTKAIANAARNMVEKMPGITLLSAEAFNTLYSAKCMQNAGSGQTYAVILAWDIFESVMVFRDIRAQIANFKHLLPNHEISGLKPTLLQLVMELCLEPEVIIANSENGSPMRQSISTLKPTVPVDDNLTKKERLTNSHRNISKLLSTVKINPLNDPTGRISAQKKNNSKLYFLPRPQRTIGNTSERLRQQDGKENRYHNQLCRSKVWPSVVSSTQDQLETKTRASLSVAEKQLIIKQTLDILFQCEFYMLVEFVECAVPLIYCLYVMVLFHLPSAKYYPDMVEMTAMELRHIVINILLYASLEVVSLFAIHYLIKWKIGFSPLHFLAFVFKTQFLEFQGRLVIWYMFVLQLMLYHCGTLCYTVYLTCVWFEKAVILLV